MEQAKQTQVCVHIRWMIRRDMPSVLGIEQSCFEFAWNEDDFIRCLRQRNCIGMVAEIDDEIVGFMIYETAQESTSHPQLRGPFGLPPPRHRRCDVRQAVWQALA